MAGETQPTILLVEDEAVIALAESRTLNRNGYAVFTAHSGPAALDLMTAQPAIDLVLMDVDLGSGMDGPQTAEIILRTKDVPILFLSSHTEPEVVARTERITSSGYVVKNSGETVLLASIRMAFKLHAAQRQAQAKARQLELTNEELSRAIGELGATNRMLEEALGEKERTEAALRLSEAEFRSLFEASPLAVGLLVDRTFLKVNSVMCETFGYSEQEMLAKSTRLLYEDEREYERMGRDLYGALRTASRATVETRMLKKDGTIMEVLIWASSMDLSGAETHSAIAAVIQDITERKRSERHLLMTEHFLQRAQEVAGVGSFIIELGGEDPALQTWRSSATMDELFGIDASYPRTGETWLALIVQRKEIAEYFQQRVFGEGRRFEHEYQIVRPKDGETRWISGLGELEFDADGSPIRMIGTVQDITERKRVSDLLNESLRDKDILFTELCHRVKNSLATILGIIDIEMGQTDEPEAQKLLVSLGDRISSIERLYALLLRSGPSATIRLDDYIASMLESLRDAYVRRDGVVIEQRLAPVESSAKSATAVGIIVNELVTNSLKHAFPEEGQGSIRVVLDTEGDRLILSVSDSGVGLPPSFDLSKSHGLGLKLAEMLSQQLGGTLSVEGTGNRAIVAHLALRSMRP